MKHEWKKAEKEVYAPKACPQLLNLPAMKYLCLKGQGNPNSEGFSRHIELLYTLSYTIKMGLKKGNTIEGYYDYVVYPLEGLWSLTSKGQQLDYLDKDELVYTLMIRQPDYLDQKTFEYFKQQAKLKKPELNLDLIEFKEITEGSCLQMLHVGSYDNEPQTFAKMNEYIMVNGLEKRQLEHKEIYLSDFRKTSQDKLKTILRYYLKETK